MMVAGFRGPVAQQYHRCTQLGKNWLMTGKKQRPATLMPRYVPGSAKHDDLVVDHYAALTTAFARSLTNSFDL